MNGIQGVLVFAVRVYRWTLSPLKSAIFGPACRCRYEPSCSAYAIEALQIHGPIVGSWLTVKRICRCHPWGGCGGDAVPGKSNSTARKPIRTGSSFERMVPRNQVSVCQESSLTHP